MIFLRSKSVIAIWAVLLVSHCAAEGLADTADANRRIRCQILLIGGDTHTGHLSRMDGGGIVLEHPESIAVPLDELRTVRFHGRGVLPKYEARRHEGTEARRGSTTPGAIKPSRDRNGAEFYLAAGGKLLGKLTATSDDAEEDDEAIFVTGTALQDRLRLSFDLLAAIWIGERSRTDAKSKNVLSSSPRSDKKNASGTAPASLRSVFDDALANRLAGKDVLITLHRGQVDTIRGRVIELGPDGGRILFNKKELPFDFKRVVGIVFAIGLGSDESWPATVHLAGGISFAARPVSTSASALHFATPFAQDIAVNTDRLVRIDFRSDRVVYLSDVTPAGEESRGLLHPAVAARIDRSSSNRPLMIDGQLFDRGIGVHAYSRIDYAIDNAFKDFVTTIGIDDAVRPRGNVVFRVEGDGRLLFDSGPVTGRDPARSFTVDVTGVSLLSLVVDFGDDLDLSDHANWADARLIKPPANPESADDRL